MLSTAPREQPRTPVLQPLLPVELTIERHEKTGEFIDTGEWTTMNKRLEEYLDGTEHRWKCNPTVGLAGRMLLHLNTIASEEVAKGQRYRHHMFRGNPNCWSPESK